MKLEEQIKKLEFQREEIKNELSQQSEAIYSDRASYEISLVLESAKNILSQEEYSNLELQISHKEKTRNIDSEERQRILEEYSEKESQSLKQRIPSKKLIQSVKELNPEKRLLAAEYLSGEFIQGGCSDILGWFKSPSTCGGCAGAQQTFNALDLWDFLEFKGDRQYGLEEKTLQEAYQKALAKDGKDISNKLDVLRKKEETVEQIQTTLDRLNKKLSAYNKIESFGHDPEKLELESPEIVQYIVQASNEDKKSIKDIKIDPDTKTLAILLDYWYYSGSGGCEYGTIIRAHRGEKSEERKFVYRDAYSPSKDDWSLSFDTITALDVQGDDVNVGLRTNQQGNERDLTTTFNVPYTTSEQKVLSEQEKEEFLKTYETKKEELLRMHTRDKGVMPGYVPFHAVPGLSDQDIPYRKAQTIDEFVNEIHGEARIVIQAQIDHSAGRGMQFEWVKYWITQDTAVMIDRDCAYEIELKQGKEIKMKA